MPLISRHTAARRDTGFTLIELMITLTTSLVVLAGVGTIYLNTITSSRETLTGARLNHDMRATMGIIRSDIQRAGFWGEAFNGVDALGTTDNPFTVIDTATAANTTDLQVLDAGRCILYSYDVNGDGIVDNREMLGFKLDAKAIKMRTSGTNTSDCHNGNWESLTNKKIITVTQLEFSTDSSTCLNLTTGTNTCSAVSSGDITVEIRAVDITLQGELSGDSEVIHRLNETVRVRNDRIIQH